MKRNKNYLTAINLGLVLLSVLLFSPAAYASVSVDYGVGHLTVRDDDCVRWRARAAEIRTKELPANTRAQRKADADLVAAQSWHTKMIAAQLASQTTNGPDSYLTKAAKAAVDRAKADVDRARREVLDVRGRRQNLNAELVRINNNIKANCSVAAIAYPNLNGNWNSNEGDSTITQNGANIHILVRDKDGVHTSSIDGRFIRKDYISFTWRNTWNHWGNGGLTYDWEQSYLHGWWLDKAMNPWKRGNWWLRAK